MNSVLVLAVFLCGLSVCYAAEGDNCTIADDCQDPASPCKDSTHHWSCITTHSNHNPHCECRNHTDPNAPHSTIPSHHHTQHFVHNFGGYCSSVYYCHITHCLENRCENHQCICHSYSSHGHHHHHDDDD